MKIVSSLLILAALTAGAAAAEVDFAAKPLNEEGKPFTNCQEYDNANPQAPVCKKMVDMTLTDMALLALNNPETGLTPEELIRRGQLAIRIRKGGKQDMAADDVKLIRDLMAKRNFAPVAFVRAIELLDPASLKK